MQYKYGTETIFDDFDLRPANMNVKKIHYCNKY